MYHFPDISGVVPAARCPGNTIHLAIGLPSNAPNPRPNPRLPRPPHVLIRTLHHLLHRLRGTRISPETHRVGIGHAVAFVIVVFGLGCEDVLPDVGVVWDGGAVRGDAVVLREEVDDDVGFEDLESCEVALGKLDWWRETEPLYVDVRLMWVKGGRGSLPPLLPEQRPYVGWWWPKRGKCSATHQSRDAHGPKEPAGQDPN